MLIIVKHLLAKISDAFRCAFNAQILDQFSCCRDFLSGKFAVKANLEIASRLEFAVQCCQAVQLMPALSFPLVQPAGSLLTPSLAVVVLEDHLNQNIACLLYTSPSPRDGLLSRMPSSA